jgi:hypothetical protein
VFDFNKVGASYLVAAVSPETCTSPIVPQLPRVKLPSSSTTPCSNEDWAKIRTGGNLLISRHVQCAVRIYPVDIDGEDGTKYGSFRWETRVNSYGQPNGLNKTFSFSSRLVRTALASQQSEKRSDALPTLRYQPVINCDSLGDNSAQCKLNPITVSVGALASAPTDPNTGWSSPATTALNLSWNGGDGTWTEFRFNDMVLYYAGPGQSIDVTASTRYWLESLTFDALRCDKKVADGTSLGCVYPRAPAILVLAANDGRIAEAAAHIREAQAAGSPGGLYIENGVAFTSFFTSPLQRTRVTALGGNKTSTGANRSYSCVYAESVMALRPKNSQNCPLIQDSPLTRPNKCDCDEYPFSSTWNGSYLNRNATSAKYIKNSENQQAGRVLGQFYANERVIDYTPDPGITFKQSLTLQELSDAIPARTGGDDFWVHVE